MGWCLRGSIERGIIAGEGVGAVDGNSEILKRRFG